MNDLFAFEESPWEVAQRQLNTGDKLSAVHFLTLMEGEEEDLVEEALTYLEEKRITLDISDLPRPAGTGEAAARLRQEEQLVKDSRLLTGLSDHDPLTLYLEELARTPACGDPERLALDALDGVDSARNMLVNVSLSQVVTMAQAHVGRGVLLMDLIQEGSMGLWQSILTWDGSGSFLACRDWYIAQAMARAVTIQARSSGVGQKMRQALEDYRMVDERLLVDLGRNPTLEEIAMELHMTVEEVAIVKGNLDAARTMNRAKQPEPEETEEEAHVEDTAYFQMRQRIGELLSALDENQARLLTLRYGLEGGLPLSPEETGKRLGLTPGEVVAQEAAALAKLRNQ